MYFSAEHINKEIPLNETITATSYTLTVISNNDTFKLDSLDIFEPDQIETFYEWSTYDQYVKALNENLIAKKTELEIKKTSIRYGNKIDFDASLVINEQDIYGVTEDLENAIGIGQIEARLDYIRTFTSVDHDNMYDDAEINEAVLNELKSIRKGAVYSNQDIRNSKTLFVAARKELEEKIYPMITIDISSVSLLQTQEGYEDWRKFRIGEKVDIFVPQLKIDIEAEIQEISISFQSYQTSIKISTVRNYDKSFGKIFSNIFLLSNKTSKNDVVPRLNEQKQTTNTVNKNQGVLDALGEDNSDFSIGYGSSDNEGIKENIVFNEAQFNINYVDLELDGLTGDVPDYYPEGTRGSALMSNGGIYLKDAEGEVRVKMNGSEGFVGYDLDNNETFKIDLEGNATFAGELKAASGTFGEVEIAENGSLKVGNITINEAGITAVSDLANPTTTQTLFIDSTNGDVFIRGTIKEGTTFEDTLTRDINVSGGTRIINYDDDNELPDGQNPNTIMSEFTANVFANGNNISTHPDTQYLWEVQGLLSVTGVTTNTRTFSPKISTTYSNDPTQIILTVTYPDGQEIVDIIPINITKDGIQGVNGFNQAQIYLYKRVSGTAPTNVGTINGSHNFPNAATVLTTNSDSWSLTIPSGAEPLYVSIGTVKSQSESVGFTQSIFSSPVKLVEDGADGLNNATVYLYKRADTMPTGAAVKPIGNTTYTFATGEVSFNNANG
jgi:hypothetical protein